MSPVLEQVMALWTGQPDDGVGLAEFRAVYTDPVDVNGHATPLAELVGRARMLRTAFAGLRHEVLRVIGDGEHVAVAFRLGGDHVGPLATPLGTVAPTGRHLTVSGMDILEIRDGRIHAVWALSDQLDLLAQAGAVDLVATARR